MNYGFLKTPLDMHLNVNLHRMFLGSWWTDFIRGLMSSQQVFKGMKLLCLSSCHCCEIKAQLECKGSYRNCRRE